MTKSKIELDKEIKALIKQFVKTDASNKDACKYARHVARKKMPGLSEYLVRLYAQYASCYYNLRAVKQLMHQEIYK